MNDRPARSLGRVAAIASVALAAAAVVMVALAPASLAGMAVHALTGGRVALGNPGGTLWNGQADIILSGGDEDIAVSTASRLPGRLAWRLAPGRLLLGTIDLTLTDEGVLESPLALRIDRGGAIAEADHLRLPASVLMGLGAPWNTIQPGGELLLEWDTLHLRDGVVRGALQAEWRNASSSLSPVVPFGHYRLLADGIFDGATLRLETVTGPMEMTGNGTIAAGYELRFHGSARVQSGTDPATATQLSGLISLLGRRDGDGEGAILNFGT